MFYKNQSLSSPDHSDIALYLQATWEETCDNVAIFFVSLRTNLASPPFKVQHLDKRNYRTNLELFSYSVGKKWQHQAKVSSHLT